jgi:hypothetical protein
MGGVVVVDLSTETLKVIGYARTIEWWAGKVKSKAPWDLKCGAGVTWVGTRYLPFPVFGPVTKISPRDAGNIHFEYTGQALGLNWPVLCAGSMVYNYLSNGVWEDIKQLWNELDGELMATEGTRLYKKYGAIYTGSCYVWKLPF